MLPLFDNCTPNPATINFHENLNVLRPIPTIHVTILYTRVNIIIMIYTSQAIDSLRVVGYSLVTIFYHNYFFLLKTIIIYVDCKIFITALFIIKKKKNVCILK